MPHPGGVRPTGSASVGRAAIWVTVLGDVVVEVEQVQQVGLASAPFAAGDRVDRCLIQRQQRPVQVRDLVWAGEAAFADAAVEVDGVGPFVGWWSRSSAPLPVAVEGASYCEYPVTILQTGCVVELPLPGGFVNRVVRVGDTVRRGLGDRAEFVHRLLRHFEQHGWAGAPRLLGVDEQGREILTFLDGYVAWQSPTDRVSSTESLVQVARLVRQFHDLTAGTPLAGDQEVVCHNDLSPKNTVYRNGGAGLLPVAFLDWDIAAPGARIHDVAHMCWQYLDLGPTVGDLATTSHRLRAMCDAYGLVDRDRVAETILWWQDRCWRGIEAGATAGDAAMVRLRDSGAARSVRAAYEWVAAHRGELETALAAP